MNHLRRIDAEILAKAGRSDAAEIFAARGLPLPDPSPKEGRGLPIPEQTYRRRLSQYGAAVSPVEGQISFLGAGFGSCFVPSSLAGAMETASLAARRNPDAWGERLARHLAALTGMAAVLPAVLTARDAASTLVHLIAEARPGCREILLAGTLPLTFDKPLRRQLDRFGFRCRTLGWEDGVVSASELLAHFSAPPTAASTSNGIAAVLVASPNALGCLEPMSEIGQIVHHRGALFIPLVDPLSLALLRTPGEVAANFCCGSLHSVGLSRRGVGDGWFVAAGEYQKAYLDRSEMDRHLGGGFPARSGGQAGEAAAFLEGLGGEGLATLAGLRLQYARFLHSALSQITGFHPAFPAKVPFFNEFVFQTPLPAEEIVAELEEQGICAGLPVRLPSATQAIPESKPSGLLVSVTERRTLREMEYFLKALKQLRDRNAGRILGADL
ncbi:Glycine cleavage system P-protein [Verrucomicrobium sp. GAS474]|uniref:hypothetical protein n=1 Tax=Verrucomicrobium sp. GAS474 TaxID=1882831 RepID=UPI00087B20D2|nr:hypothetical protein [Verrucomicrobium sp. GAS474]SDU22291.1 Glycine cleavage system P-protein [Verrucomicrobium sp. GAS474]